MKIAIEITLSDKKEILALNKLLANNDIIFTKTESGPMHHFRFSNWDNNLTDMQNVFTIIKQD